MKHFFIFFKYAVVGISGTIIDVCSLYVLVDVVHVPVLVATAASFLLAAVNNFVWNKVWTFENRSGAIRKQFIKFLIVSSTGLLLTEACMAVLVYAFGLWYIASKLITSAVVLAWNFLANKNWTFRDGVRSPIPDGSQSYDLSIIIPAYNEERRIGKTLDAIDRYFRTERMTREIIVVDDGSADGTSAVVQSMKKDIPDLALIRSGRNRGKGHAVKTGIENSRGTYILFTDADNSTPIGEVARFLPLLRDCPVVIGSRYIKGSSVTIKQPAYRILLGRTGNFLIQLFLLDNIRDTQCGFKAFQYRAAKDIFSRMKVNGFGFDIELLAIAGLLHYQVREVPISWYNSFESRVRPIKDALRTFAELLYVKINLWSGRYE